MSFEFEREEDAKDCINSVSSLYKQLKDSQKRLSRRSAAQTGSSGAARTPANDSNRHDRREETKNNTAAQAHVPDN
eukprot:CAMPEP_0185576536 /NCGR_PEP_ID=MMETSP0434-20130131/7442_1 /TAXON_ID=626734 ORGANISM="Favella taraikaensis, Strain Fe Narragansett Bay" /NCGR_SAMPLE_ID=MMETSP0434 /ASSEMBLY_ACC=CAM_ASM_000379 /LENGTH=75 /DNA_ID=CAMNT_0028193781 /DNA_START=1889 /DNA_END=2116 /DNA_ORIENTATION=+